MNSPAADQAVLTREISQSGSLDSELVAYRIDVNTRSSWHQRTLLTLPELEKRIEAIATAEWLKFHGWRTIEVVATDAQGLIVLSTGRGETPPPCPRCGFTR